MTDGITSRVVIDSCVFINALCGGTDPREQERHPYSLRLFDAAEVGTIEAVIPAIVCAEVLGAGAIRGNHVQSSERRPRRLAARDWLTNGRFLMVEVDRTIVEHAAELSWRYQLKGADAIVLATAIDSECEALYTWDSDLLKVPAAAGVRIIEPVAFSDREDDLFSMTGR